MEFKAKLNRKFYIVSFLLLAMVVFGWYGVFFLNTNQILMEDNTPMDNQTKMLFTIVTSAVVLSWTFSLFIVARQILLGYAFSMGEDGISLTATAINVLAFIFVVPIRKIPYSSIERVSQDNGVLTLHIDKSKLDIISMFRVFVRKEYPLFSGFTVKSQEEIKAELEKHGIYFENL